MSKPSGTNSPTSSSVWDFLEFRLRCCREWKWDQWGIARKTVTHKLTRKESCSNRRRLPGCLFSETYCGGYSGEDPPLPIPNREVKLTIADGTAPPGGRVGSCHFLIRHPVILRWRGVLLYIWRDVANFPLCKDFQKSFKKVWRLRKKRYLCTPNSKRGHLRESGTQQVHWKDWIFILYKKQVPRNTNLSRSVNSFV